MEPLRFALIADGSFDRVLIPIIKWALKDAGIPSVDQFAGPQRLPRKLPSLAAKLAAAVDLFPCQILFVHRDAEGEVWDVRRNEIERAFLESREMGLALTAVAMIPVRMSEAWLCFDEKAIREASGNPAGRIPLAVPDLARIETSPDPKSKLQHALRTASELGGRRRKSFDPHEAVHLVANNIRDYSPLRKLSAFQRFESAIKEGQSAGWRPGFYAG
jgi:hypothetical protein